MGRFCMPGCWLNQAEENTSPTNNVFRSRSLQSLPSSQTPPRQTEKANRKSLKTEVKASLSSMATSQKACRSRSGRPKSRNRTERNERKRCRNTSRKSFTGMLLTLANKLNFILCVFADDGEAIASLSILVPLLSASSSSSLVLLRHGDLWLQ